MTGQRHRIRRQVLEITVPDQGAAWQLSSELTRIQRDSLEAIIDQCCTEAGDPDRLHRIESLEVDLGQLQAGRLEQDLVEKLGPRLREALVARVHAEDQATSLAGADPEVIARLELVAFFARTGSLPWWADASSPRLVDDTVKLLLPRAPGPLVALVRTLAHAPGELRRLVLHCEDERLSALFAAVIAAGPRGQPQRAAELRGLWLVTSPIAGVPPGAFRSALWVAALRAASLEDSAGTDAAGFWRSALAQAALALGVTYTSLVASLREAPELDRENAVAAIVHRLYREVRGETAAGDAAPLPSDAEADALRAAHRVLRSAIEDHGDRTADRDAAADRDASADRDAPTADRDAPAPDRDADADPGGARGDVGTGDLETLLDRLERAELLPRALSTALRALAGRSTARDRIRLRRMLEDLAAILPATLAPTVAALDAGEHLGQAGGSPQRPAHAVHRALEALERAAGVDRSPRGRGQAQPQLRSPMPAEPPDRAAGSPPLDLDYGDSEHAYVDNAGLVILWPFLGHLFQRLELMSDKQFKDAAARHRAVGVLSYLATQDPWPQEYQLLLPKVLCGMSVRDVFDFGPPVTEAEAEESADMLTAVIANAPILREMSTDGFRGSFLLRKGALGARDGAWLLRVERAAYDVVLDRFPWAVSWVKLPWMEAPISVEW